MSGKKADYNSCFKVDTSAFTGDYVFGLDHGYERMQNAVILVQDQLWGAVGEMETKDFNDLYASNWEVSIGKSLKHDENPLCPGDPFLSPNYGDYIDENALENFYPTPNAAHGFKKFCNMSGRYTFFIAKKVPKISLSICSVGVFGPSYKRKEVLHT